MTSSLETFAVTNGSRTTSSFTWVWISFVSQLPIPLTDRLEYSFFKEIIEEAKEYSLSLLDRIPVPQYKETVEGKSQERILLHYVNPSQKGVLNTEKIDYGKFYETLCRFIVRSE